MARSGPDLRRLLGVGFERSPLPTYPWVVNACCLCCSAGMRDNQGSTGYREGGWGQCSCCDQVGMRQTPLRSVCIQGDQDIRRTVCPCRQGLERDEEGGHSGNPGCLRGQTVPPAICSLILLVREFWTLCGSSNGCGHVI